MEKPSLKDRIQYWFDNRMIKGSGHLIGILLGCSAAAVVLLVVIMTAVTHDAGNFYINLWNGFVTMINAWMPEYVPDPNDPPEVLSLIFNALIALCGILFTSVLIGVVTSMIEEKIVSLRKGDSPVLESGHTVVLGFYAGEYTLLKELILAAAKDSRVIVVAGDEDIDAMEQQIKENIDVPKTIRLICRSIDIFDPASLSRLALNESSEIVISPTSNYRAAKIILALLKVVDKESAARINAIIYKDEYLLPETTAKKHHVSILKTNDTIAKVIAHSCIQPGLSDVFTEIFNFEGDEFYLVTMQESRGMTFRELSQRLKQATPIGLIRDGETIVNPDGDTMLTGEERIILFTQDRASCSLMPSHEDRESLPEKVNLLQNRKKKKVCIIGSNKQLPIILETLPQYVNEVLLVNVSDADSEKLAGINKNLHIKNLQADLLNEDEMIAIVTEYHHVVLLSRNEEDDDKEDMKTSFLLLRLRDIRSRNHLRFNITAEMHRESNQSLVVSDDATDFVVASNLASLFLAQLAETPDLDALFSELLSNEGNELQLLKAKYLNAAGTYTASQLRGIAADNGYVFLGYRPADGPYCFNPPLEERITLEPYQYLVLIGPE